MTETVVRVPPLDPKDFTAEQAELVGDWTHLVFSRVIVRLPHIYRNFVPHIAANIAGSTLPPREREIVVLHMLSLCGDTYELEHHKTIAQKNTGMSAEDIEAAVKGEGACLSDFDRVLIRATRELRSDQVLSDASWAALGERYDDEQRMQVVFLSGLYLTMAMLTKSFGIPMEDGDQDLDRIQKLRDYT